MTGLGPQAVTLAGCFPPALDLDSAASQGLFVLGERHWLLRRGLETEAGNGFWPDGSRAA